MTKTLLKRFKKQLTTLRTELAAKVADLTIDTDGDDTDAIQGKMLINLATQLTARDRTKLVAIDAALDRIDDGSYGVCNDCGEDVASARLAANPTTNICIDCAEHNERLAKQETRR